jgi:excisionase family DNA binding protein
MTDAERRAKLRDAIALLVDVMSANPAPVESVAPSAARVAVLDDPETVAARLRLSVSTVYRLARNGTLQGIKVGTGWRFDRRAVDAYLAAQTRRGAGGEDGGLTE